MRGITLRLARLEAVHEERSRPQPVGFAYCPLLQGEPYSVDLPDGRHEFKASGELLAFLDERGLIGDGLLRSPGMRSEADWLEAVASK